jgi:hypothetical protein
MSTYQRRQCTSLDNNWSQVTDIIPLTPVSLAYARIAAAKSRSCGPTTGSTSLSGLSLRTQQTYTGEAVTSSPAEISQSRHKQSYFRVSIRFRAWQQNSWLGWSRGRRIPGFLLLNLADQILAFGTNRQNAFLQLVNSKNSIEIESAVAEEKEKKEARKVSESVTSPATPQQHQAFQSSPAWRHRQTHVTQPWRSLTRYHQRCHSRWSRSKKKNMLLLQFEQHSKKNEWSTKRWQPQTWCTEGGGR